MRLALWALGGIVLGLIIHLVSILILPQVVGAPLFSRVSALNALNRTVVLPPLTAGNANPFGLDPKFTYAVCALDLREGPGTVRGVLPQAFWSVSAYAPSGVSLYSTTNRSSATSVIDLAVFTPPQLKALDNQEIPIIPDTLIAESTGLDVFVVVRLAAAQAGMQSRYRTALKQLSCGPLQSDPNLEDQRAPTPAPARSRDQPDANNPVPIPLNRPTR